MYNGQHCGGTSSRWGTSISQWADGSDARYNAVYRNFEECQRICAAHEECQGFVYHRSYKQCGWKKKTFNPWSSPSHDCYEKKEKIANAPTPQPVEAPENTASGTKSTLSPVHPSEFVKVWDTYNTDDDNYLDTDELTAFLSAHDLPPLLNIFLGQFDYDNNGKLDLAEFALLQPVTTSVIDFTASSADAGAAFTYYDRDDSGLLEKFEAMGFIRDLVTAQDNAIWGVLKDQYTSIYDLYDADKDNKLNENELGNILPG